MRTSSGDLGDPRTWPHWGWRRGGRPAVLLAVGALLVAGSTTVLFLGMRDVMEIGGACASGQSPFPIEDPCPEGTWMVPLSFFVGAVGVGLYLWGSLGLSGPRWALLAWSALFLSLGWNFWEFGLDPPSPAEGLAWGWIVCGVVFVAMGGGPLVVLLGWRDARRKAVWADAVHDGPAGRRAQLALHLGSIVAGVLLGRWLFSLAT